MVFCKYCGAQVQEDVRFCPACGKEMEGNPQQPGYTAQPGYAAQPGQYDEARDIQDNKVMAVLSYLSLLFLIPLCMGTYKTSPYTKFHLNQGIVLFIASAIFSIAYGIVMAILGGIFTAVFLYSGFWVIWTIISTILGLAYLIPAVFCILGIINAATGKCKPLPIIGKFSVIK